MIYTIAKIIIVATVIASQFLLSQTALQNLSASSQQVVAYAEVPPLQKEVTEVSLTISVTDRKGHFIHGLGQSDFTILDNSRHQTAITFFQSQTGLPLDIALVMDVSASMTARFQAEKDAVDEFLREVMRPGDSGQVFAFDQTLRARVPITYKGRKLLRSLRKLAPDGDTALYDAVHTAAQWLGQESRLARKVMVLMSDGEENDSRTTFDVAVNSLLNSEAVVYTVNVGDDYNSELGKAGVALLKRLSEATGGRYFEVPHNVEVGSAFHKIRKELRSQYAIAYKPSNLALGPFHDIRVMVRNLHVHCRTGYYTK